MDSSLTRTPSRPGAPGADMVNYTLRHRPAESSRVGVLLLNSRHCPVYYNAEAATILGYPNKPRGAPSLEAVLSAQRSQLTGRSMPELPSAIAFTSGRRRYLCRTFVLESNKHAEPRLQLTSVVVLEREVSPAVDLMRWSEESQLTARERETVQLLLHGLTSKEIADQMSISPSTVKTFLKLVMAKVGASNRTGIIAKFIDSATGVPPSWRTEAGLQGIGGDGHRGMNARREARAPKVSSRL